MIPDIFCSDFASICLQIFSHILKREFQESHTKLSRKFTEWVYGPITCSLYDLASVDSYEDNSVLEILVYGSDIPVSPSTVSPLRVTSLCTPTCVSCLLLAEPPRDAPHGASEPAAGLQVEEVCRSNVFFQLPGLPPVPDHVHCCSLQQAGWRGELAATNCVPDPCNRPR